MSIQTYPLLLFLVPLYNMFKSPPSTPCLPASPLFSSPLANPCDYLSRKMLEIIPQALNVHVSHFLEIVVTRSVGCSRLKPTEDIFHLHDDSFEVPYQTIRCIYHIPPSLGQIVKAKGILNFPQQTKRESQKGRRLKALVETDLSEKNAAVRCWIHTCRGVLEL